MKLLQQHSTHSLYENSCPQNFEEPKPHHISNHSCALYTPWSRTIFYGPWLGSDEIISTSNTDAKFVGFLASYCFLGAFYFCTQFQWFPRLVIAWRPSSFQIWPNFHRNQNNLWTFLSLFTYTYFTTISLKSAVSCTSTGNDLLLVIWPYSLKNCWYGLLTG